MLHTTSLRTTIADQGRKESADAREFSRSEVVLFLSGLILFIIVLSVLVFSSQSLRLDEAQSLWQTSHTPLRMVSIIAEDVHVPLYHLILHFWQFLFGNNVAIARLLSLIFFILVIPSMYMLGSRAWGKSIGLFAALLAAISPFLNWYGNEIRMYSLFALLTVLNQYFFMSIFLKAREADDDVSGKIWLGYIATLVLGLFTHYFFILNAVTQAVFFLLYRRVFPRAALRKFLLTILFCAIVFTPWIYFVTTLGGASNTQPALEKPSAINVFNTFSQFIFGFQNDHVNTILISLWPLLVLLVFLSLRRNQRVGPQTVYLFFSLFLPILIVFAVSTTTRPIFLSRYLILSLPSLYLLIAWILGTYPERLARALKIVLVIGMLTMLGVEIVNAASPIKENYREASAYLEAHARAQDIIVVSAPFTIYPVEYYYKGPANIQTLPSWNRYTFGPIPSFSEEKLSGEVEAIKGDHQLLWLLLSYDQGYEEKIRLYFDNNFERVLVKEFSKGLNLYAYKLRYDSPDINEILRRGGSASPGGSAGQQPPSLRLPTQTTTVDRATSSRATTTGTTSTSTEGQ
jgi:mannosyltransferase